MDWSWMMPESVSTYGARIDQMYYVILWITGVVFVASEATLIWFLWKYRHQEGRKAEYIHGNNTAEIIWTVVPFFIVMGIALGSRGLWADIRGPDSVPDGAMPIIVDAKQFEWTVTYPGVDGTFGTADDHASRNIMTIPVGQPVNVTLTATDVLHSFFLPDFRVKQDAVPGMEIPVWFEATTVGEYPIGCAELCGIGHTTMGGTLIVLSQADFDTWEAEQQAAALPELPEMPQ